MLLVYVGSLPYWQICFELLGLKKKLCAVAIKKPYAKLAKWIKAITNHLYWTADSTDAHSELRIAKWLSVENHIANIHDHDGAYQKCEHGDLSQEEPQRDWIDKGMNSSLLFLILNLFHSLRTVYVIGLNFPSVPLVTFSTAWC